MQAQDLVNGALRLIGAIASGETPSTSEASDGLTLLQQMLDSWSAEELLVFATTTQNVSMTANTGNYTLATRPVKILAAELLVGTMNFPLEVVGPQAWAAAPDKTDVSAHMKRIYCDYGYPTATLHVAPVPNSTTASVNLYQTTDLATLASETTTFSMPEAYSMAVMYNLAVLVAPQYGRAVDGAVLATAQQTKAALKMLLASNEAGKSELEIPPVSGSGGAQ